MRSIASHGLADATRCAVAVRRAAAIAMFSVALAGCGGGSEGDAGTANPPPPLADTIAPTLSALSASAGFQDTTVSWTTDEPSDSQVEYGTSAAYGSSTSLAAALVSSHTVTLSGLSASTAYHYRVKSRDAAGNLATSADGSFSTTAAPDTTAPVVSISSPTSGATVSTTVSIAATATDNVGVTGVQFRVDGTAVGSEDTTNPYSASWNTTTVGNGSHALTAVARDAAGNQTTSATVNVTVNNAAPPPGAAITVGQIIVDRPTLETIGVSLPITAGDTNHNASVAVRYRRVGDPTWKDALPLLRVRPENLSFEDPTPFTVDEQFAGSVFDLTPNTDYEIELSVHDPDSGDATRTATVHTRPVPPANPATPHAVAVSTLGQLNTALANAAAGDVITLADGTYNGSIAISRSGTISIAWYDGRDVEDNSDVSLMMASSTDGGKSFSKNRMVSTEATNLAELQQTFSFSLGDYSSSISTNSYFIPFWSDGRSGTHIDLYCAFVPLDGGLSSIHQISANQNQLVGGNLYPNPASRGSRLNVSVPTLGKYSLRLYDLLGNTLVESTFQGKETQIVVPATVRTGAYFFRVNAEDGKTIATGKVLLK